MKVFLLRVCAFQKEFSNLCNAYQYRSLVFYNLNEALRTGKALLKGQMKELFRHHESKKYYKKISDEFIEDCIDYIFEIEESDPEKQKRWQPGDEDYWEIKHPYFIKWEYNYKGKLTGRWFGGKPERKGFPSDCYDFRPGDEKPDAGTLFSLGEFVCLNDGKDKNIYVIGGIPLKNGDFFENHYTCEFIQNGYVSHVHPHESDMERFPGEVPESLQWLSRYFKGEIKISDEDAKKILNGEYSFDDCPSYKKIQTI